MTAQIASPASEVDAADYDFAIARGYEGIHLANDLRMQAANGFARGRWESRRRNSDCRSRPALSGWAGCDRGVRTEGVSRFEDRRGEQFGVGEDVGDEDRVLSSQFSVPSKSGEGRNVFALREFSSRTVSAS